MKIGGLCIDRKVVIGLAVAALGIFLFDPGLIRVVLPLMLVAICPLSMIFMMRVMGGHQNAQPPAATTLGSGKEHADVPSLRRDLAELSAKQAWISAQISGIEASQASPTPVAQNGKAAAEPIEREPGARSATPEG